MQSFEKEESYLGLITTFDLTASCSQEKDPELAAGVESQWPGIWAGASCQRQPTAPALLAALLAVGGAGPALVFGHGP